MRNIGSLAVVAWLALLFLPQASGARPYDRLFSGQFEILDRRIEVTPGTALLTTMGQQLMLSSRVYQGNNEDPGVVVTWHSSDPAAVSVDSSGVVTSHVSVGSVVVTAEAPGAAPTPVLVIVASPTSGTQLLNDDQIVGEPMGIDEPSTYGVGYQYQVTLNAKPLPSVGDLVVNTGQKPVAGRVISVDESGGLPLVVLEIRPLAELFDELEVQEVLNVSQLAQIQISEDFANYSVQRAPSGGITLIAPEQAGKAIVPVGDCETPDLSDVFDFGFTQQGDTLYIDPDLDLILDYSVLDGLQRLELVGSVQSVLDINLTLNAEVEASVKCKIDIVTLVIPFGGPIGLILSPRIPLGVGFDLTGKVSNSLLRHNMTLASRLDVSGGIECAPDCEGIGNISATSQYVERVLVEGDSDPTLGAFQVELAAFAYAFASLALGPVIPALDIEFELITAQGGNEQQVSLRSAVAQVNDPNYAGEFDLSTKWTLALGSSIQGILDLLSINQLGDFQLEYVNSLARSPAGMLTIEGSDPGSATPSVAVGETATFTVALDPVLFLGAGSVVAVELSRKVDNGQGGLTLEPNRPGCATMVAQSPQQTSFICQASFLDEHIGTQSVVAFVRAKLFGFEVPIPLEIGPDAVATLQVTEPDDDDDDDDDDDPTVTADFTAFAEIGYVDLSGGGGPGAIGYFRDEERQESEENSFQASISLNDSATHDGSTGSAKAEIDLVGSAVSAGGEFQYFDVRVDIDLSANVTPGSDQPLGAFGLVDVVACSQFESRGGAMSINAEYTGDEANPNLGTAFSVYVDYEDPVSGEDIYLVDEDLEPDQPFQQSLAAPVGAFVNVCLDGFRISVEESINYPNGGSFPSRIQGTATLRLTSG